MPNQHTTSRNFKSLARAMVIALVMILLAQSLDLPARHLLDFLTTAVQHTVVLLPSLALTAWQGRYPAAAFEQPRIAQCALHLLLVWPLLSATTSLGASSAGAIGILN
jgi:hypothetical protein